MTKHFFNITLHTRKITPKIQAHFEIGKKVLQLQRYIPAWFKMHVNKVAKFQCPQW